MTINFKNVVVDDLRYFVDTPPCMHEAVIYLRNQQEYTVHLMEVAEAIEIENLWLDFDLGGACETPMPLIGYLEMCSRNNPDAIKVENVFVVTSNPVGKRILYDAAMTFTQKLVHVINAVDYGLINPKDW